MTALQSYELTPGVCTFIDLAVLAQRADTLRSPHVSHDQLITKAARLPFLVIDYLAKRSACLCLPLFDHQEEEGQVALNDDLKEKGGIGWQTRASYVTPKDGWLITIPSLKLASECDVNSVQNRMRYARRNGKELYRLKQFAVSPDADFVPVWDRPTTLMRPTFNEVRNRRGFDMSRTFGSAYGREGYGRVG
jgi:hypothetical protein